MDNNNNKFSSIINPFENDIQHKSNAKKREAALIAERMSHAPSPHVSSMKIQFESKSNKSSMETN